MKCEYCGKIVPDTMYECPFCGAGNPGYKRFEKEAEDARRKIAELEKENAEREKSQLALQKKRDEEAAEKNAEHNGKMILAFKLSLILSVFSAFSITSAHLNLFFLIYIVCFIVNLFIFGAVSGFTGTKTSQIIVSTALCAVFCILVYPAFRSPKKTNDRIEYTAPPPITSTVQTQPEKIYGKPRDGMTLEEVQAVQWGYRLVVTKCRDFDRLRMDHRYCEVKWYDKDGNKIGSGQISYDKDGNTKLHHFRDYTEE